MTSHIIALYHLSTKMDPLVAAAVIAGEQSSGTFIAIPGEDEALKARAAAQFEITPLHAINSDSTTGNVSGGVPRYLLKLIWPFHNVGASLPQLLATVAGNLYELKPVVDLKLIDLYLPQEFANAYPGPAFGVAGTRRLSGVMEGPVIGTIIKPSVGLSATDTAAFVKTLCESGIDFIKDDELQGDGPSCTFEERAHAVMRVINNHADQTGRKVMYAFNLTGELSAMMHHHDLILSLGGTCAMVSLNSVGLVGFNAFRRHCQLPIHAHRNGWGALNKSWSYIAWQKIWRLAGVDHMHVNGLANKFNESDESVTASALECLKPMFTDKPCTVMPVFSSGQTAKQAPGTFKLLDSTDSIFVAGGGLFGHPGGIRSGVTALRQAWEAAMLGIPLAQAALTQRELKEALDTFGY